MPTHTEVAPPTEKSERAPRSAPPGAVVASPRGCPICGTPLRGRQRCCSAKCRAAKSRRARIPVKREQLLEIRRLLRAVLEESYRAKVALDTCFGG